MPIFRLISVLFLSSCHRIVEKCHTKKQLNEGDNENLSEEEEDVSESDEDGEEEEEEDGSIGNQSQGKDGSDESFDE